MERFWGMFIPHIHILIVFWVIYDGYLGYEDYLFRLEGVTNQSKILKTKVAQKQREKNKMKDYFSDMEAAKKRIENIAQEVEAVQKKLPKKISNAAILDHLTNQANRINIKDFTSEPGKDLNKGFYIIREFKFDMVSTYLQLIVFFELIDKTDQLLNIKNLEIVHSGVKTKSRFGLIKAKGVIEAFRYNNSHKEDRGIKKIEKKFK